MFWYLTALEFAALLKHFGSKHNPLFSILTSLTLNLNESIAKPVTTKLYILPFIITITLEFKENYKFTRYMSCSSG